MRNPDAGSRMQISHDIDHSRVSDILESRASARSVCSTCSVSTRKGSTGCSSCVRSYRTPVTGRATSVTTAAASTPSGEPIDRKRKHVLPQWRSRQSESGSSSGIRNPLVFRGLRSFWGFLSIRGSRGLCGKFSSRELQAVTGYLVSIIQCCKQASRPSVKKVQ